MNTPDRRPPAPQPSPANRWLPAIAAIAVLVAVIASGAFGNDDDDRSVSAGQTDQAATSITTLPGSSEGTGYEVTGLTVPISTLPPVMMESTTAPINKTQLARTLMVGTFGDDVAALQTRLTQLGFAPGVADGAFGSQTQQAVWAFEKLVLRTPRSAATGHVTNEMWQRMQDPIVVQPRRAGAGTHVEIYLPEQVAAVFTDGRPTLIIHISSGDGQTWCETVVQDTDAEGNPLDPPVEKPVCGVSYTPGGVFRFRREVVGDRVGALGRMFNPIYFNYGIAMHGAKEVPLHPASHGCIRMHKTISDTFQSYVHLRDVVYVWGEDGREPEQYTKKQSTPIFNYPDPTATTTTTIKPTTTTTKAATTTTSSKQPATTTTAKPAATTTTTTTVKPAATTTTPPNTTPPTTTTAPPATTQPAATATT